MILDSGERSENAVIDAAFNELYKKLFESAVSRSIKNAGIKVYRDSDFEALYCKLFAGANSQEDEGSFTKDKSIVPSPSLIPTPKPASEPQSPASTSRKSQRVRKPTAFYTPHQIPNRANKKTKALNKRSKSSFRKLNKRVPLDRILSAASNESSSILGHFTKVNQSTRNRNNFSVPEKDLFYGSSLGFIHPNLAKTNFEMDPLEAMHDLPMPSSTFIPFQLPGSRLL